MDQIKDIMEKNVITIEHDKTALDAACLKHWRFKNLMNLEYVMPVDLQRKK